ncbi:MAG: hypothetical protein FWE91_08580 [Defluviitaleaceae bacterium]|nr:hypothetical protein [Defluviitaleaceae bacterium]MCL2835256.1 hypothetical protein [Defluviitaleaceae bacterium]
MKKSLFGLSENMAAAFAYVGVFVTGIIVLVMEKENKTLRFHALQSVVLFAGLCILTTVMGWLPIINLLAWIPRTLTFVAWLFLTFMAYKGALIKVPVIGDACWAHIHKDQE